MNELEYFDATRPRKLQGWNTILATEDVHPYFGAWWPPGHIIGYEHTFVHEMYDFLNCIAGRKQASPDFGEGLQVQAVLDAVTLSIRKRRWAKVSEVTRWAGAK